jgi:hypothetical protein
MPCVNLVVKLQISFTLSRSTDYECIILAQLEHRILKICFTIELYCRVRCSNSGTSWL